MMIPLRACAFLFTGALICLGQNQPASKTEEIHKLIELTGVSQSLQQISDQLIMQLKPIVRQAVQAGVQQNGQKVEHLDDAIDAIMQELQKRLLVKDVIERIIPVYDKYLSGEEVHALIEFYESSVGRRLAEVQPKMLLESAEVGQAWGKEVAQRVMSDPDLLARVAAILKGEQAPK